MAEDHSKRERWIPVGFWLVYALTRVGVALRGGPLITGNDDLTRVVQVRQWLAGQSWFDLTLYRLHPPDGVAMHWTRHTDLLLAGLGMASRGEGAERFAVIALPLLLALGVYVLVGTIARRVGGRPAVPAALLLLLASALTAQQFAPGRVDHHGLQILLLLVAVVGLIRFERPAWATVSGAAIGTSLSVGLEQLAVVVAVIATVDILGLRQPDLAPGLRGFGLAMAGASVGGALLFAPAERLFGVACDVFSLPHLVAVAVVAVTFVVLSRHRRAVVLASGGVVAALAALATGPRCVDPYTDVDPVLRELWLANVAEAQGMGSMLTGDPWFALAVIVPGVVALGAALWWWWKAGWGTGTWFRLLVVLTAAYATAVLQFRAAPAATALSVPVLGVVFARTRDRLDAWPMLGRVGVMLVVAVVISGLGPLLVGVASDGQAGPGEDCSVAGGALGGLDGLVLAPMDLGPDLLHGTDADVLAAPYHRNNEGNRLAWDLFLGSPDEADLSARGIDWVVTCDGMAENNLLVREAPEGLLAALLADDVPSTLEVTDLGGRGLTVYRVRG